MAEKTGGTNLTTPSGGGAPSGAAGGDLAGTYPNPTVKASVGLTGTPTAPTAAVDTNTTQIASTAMVLAQAGAATPLAAAATAVVGTSTRFARADHVHPTNSAYPLMANVVAPYDPRLTSSLAVWPTANTMIGTRIVIPYTGTLKDIAVYIGVSSGNIDVAVLDTVATTRTVLYSKGTTVMPAGSQWQIIGDPNLSVTRGDQYDLIVSVDNITASFLRLAVNAPAQVTMPTGFWTAPNGGFNHLVWTKATSFPIPVATSTVAESGMSSTSAGYGLFVMARMSASPV